jgi:hypothetical protein
MAKLKLELIDLKVDSFDPTPNDGPGRGTVVGRQTYWGLCSGNSCEAFCSFNNPSCYGSCDTVCIDCETAGCPPMQWSDDGSTCVSTCVQSCGGTCDCTVADTCRCI